MDFLDPLREINLVSVAVRILLALAVGGVLGMERGIRNRPAGFRTYMLVCLGAALVMMTNQYVYQYFGVSDPVRMGAQVISGIGFLGAGTIILTGKSQVRGITTAAGLWAAACCGLAIGIGFYEGALAGGVAVFLVMALLQRADVRIRGRAGTAEVYIELEDAAHLGSVIAHARESNIDVFDIQIQKTKGQKGAPTGIVLTARPKEKMAHEAMLEALGAAPGVGYIEELQ